MSLSSENMQKLMAYVDGELEGAELEEAQKLLVTETDAVRFVEQVAGLGEIIGRGHAVRSGKAIAKFDVTDDVMALVKRESATTQAKTGAAGAKVSSLAAAREKARETRSSGLKVGAGVAAALALAASIFVFARHATDEAPMAAGPSQAVLAPATAPIAPSATTGTGVDVSTVNSPGNSVSVFYLPTANELSTSVVVWVDETGEK